MRKNGGNKMLVFLNIIMLIVIFGLFIFSVWYTAFRLHAHFKTIPFWTLQIAVAFGAIGSFAALLITSRFSSLFVSVINILSGYVLIFIIYLFFLLAILHIIQLKWNLPLLWSGVTALAIAFIITTIGAVLASSFIVKETKISIPRLENEITIMQISDLHLGHQRGRNYLEKIVNETNKQNPDLVVITGDFIDGLPALLSGVLNPLSNIKAPVYFVKGNHDEDTGTDTLKLIGAQNVHIMYNEIIETHGIQLVGLDYMKADDETFDMHPSDNPNTIKSILEEISLKSNIPSILLHHSPVGVKYVEAAGIDLMLSGHTHNGQIFPFSLFAKLSFPLISGLYQQGNTKIFVSNGAGTYMIRSRLGSFNEINLLRLIPER